MEHNITEKKQWLLAGPDAGQAGADVPRPSADAIQPAPEQAVLAGKRLRLLPPSSPRPEAGLNH